MFSKHNLKWLILLPGLLTPWLALADRGGQAVILGADGKFQRGPTRVVDLTLKDLNGKPVKTTSYQGNVTVFFFAIVDLPGSQDMVPALNAVQRKYARRGLKVVGVALDCTADQVRAFSKKWKCEFDWTIGEAALMADGGPLRTMPLMDDRNRQSSELTAVVCPHGRVRESFGFPVKTEVLTGEIDLVLARP